MNSWALIYLLEQKVSRLRLCEMRVVKYYIVNKALFETLNKVNENKVLSYHEALKYLWNNKKVVLQYVKLTNPLSYKLDFPKFDGHTGGK